MAFILVLFYLVSPAVILYSCKKVSFLDKFGAVGIAYVLGLLLGNIGVMNVNSKAVQEALTTITIPLSLPLLLFSINLKQWSRLAGRTILSMVLGIVAITTAIVVGFYLFRQGITDCWKVAGMLTGVYLGATFNMASIKIALGASDEMFGICNAYDIIVCMFYFMFIISVAQRIFNLVLPPFKKAANEKQMKADVEDIYDGWDSYKGIFSRRYLLPLLVAVAVAVGIASIAGGISFLFPKVYMMAIVILVITTLSILASLNPRLNSIPKTFQAGMYLILIFCVVVGSMADVTMFAKTSIYVLYYVIFVIFTSLGLHFLLAWIFRIDTDTLIISSSAMIFSPPFVPAIANALNNKEIILSGLTVGIVGYSVGNYIGIALAYLLR